MARPVALLVSLALAAALASCHRQADRPGEAAFTTLAADFAGCALVRRGPVCELRPGTPLRVWVPGSPADERRVDSDDGPLDVGAGEERGGGRLFRVAVPPGARRLDWRERRGRAWQRWQLALAPAPAESLIDRATALRGQGRGAEARGLLEAALPTLAPELAGRARATIARIDRDLGQGARALAELEATMAEAERAGRLTDAVNDAFLILFAAQGGPSLGGARALLARARPWAVQGDDRGALGYVEGLLLDRTGDQRGALRVFRRVADEAERLDDAATARQAEEQVALLLAALGRTVEAFALQQRLVAEGAQDPACQRTAAAINLAWIVLLDRARRAGAPGPLPAPDPFLAAARTAAAGCDDVGRKRITLINDGLHAADGGDVDTLARSVAALAQLTAGRGPEEAVWEAELGARLAWRRGQRAAALAGWQRQEELARALGWREGALRAAGARGQALAALGRRAEATRALAAAEALLDEIVGTLPLAEGRALYLAHRDEGTRLLVSTLVQLGRPDQAAAAARRARARLLRSLVRAARLDELSGAERQRWDALVSDYRSRRAELEATAERDWTLTAAELATARRHRGARDLAARALLDEAHQLLDRRRPGAAAAGRLAQPGPGELFLVYAPRDRGFWGFALAAGAPALARAIELSAEGVSSGTALGARLLEPFTARVAAARVVRIHATGAADAVAWSRVPWRGRPLGEARAVEHGLDLGEGRAALARAGARGDRSVLVVADPTGDLPGAASEGEVVAAALGGGRAAVTALVGSGATRAAVVSALPAAATFHYAGHSTAAGPDGAESAMPLARGGRLLLTDVLALAAAPALVVLSSCEAAGKGRAPADGAADLGLAHAFLSAGAAEVVAATRRVDDQAAVHLMRRFYAELSRAQPLSAAEALRNARAARDAGPDDADAAAEYRVLVP